MSDDDLPPTHRPGGAGDSGQQVPYQPPPNPYPQPGSFDQYAAPSPHGTQPYGTYPQGYGAVLPEHPSATTTLVLGIIGLAGIAFCGGLTLVVSPFAWAIGRRAVREIDAAPGRYSGREKANAGRIMGLVGTILLAVGVLAVAAFIVLAIAISPGQIEIGPNQPVTHHHHAFLHS
jgi:hypothetical protein